MNLPARGYTTAPANLTITVQQPLTLEEQFREFWNTYGGIIGLIGGGFAAGFSALLIDRLKKRSRSSIIP